MSTPPTPIEAWSALPFFTIVKTAVQNVVTKTAYVYMVVAMKALSTVCVVLAATVSLYIY